MLSCVETEANFMCWEEVGATKLLSTNLKEGFKSSQGFTSIRQTLLLCYAKACAAVHVLRVWRALLHFLILCVSRSGS